MYCQKCGSIIESGERFCSSCGAPVDSGAPNAMPVSAAPVKSGKNKLVGLIAAGVAVVAVIVILVCVFSGGGYKSVVNKFIDASCSADGKTIASLIPDEVIKVECEEVDATKSELIKYFTEQLEEALEYNIERYGDWSYSYEIIEVEDYSRKALKSLQEDYEDEFDVDVKAAKTVTVKLTIKADDDNEFSNSLDVGVIKVGRSWYIDALSGTMLWVNW